ncbi:MAG TPA: hypothetical protein VFO63_06050, partial [Blastocatellia bacterium]|nr:hypothetical protein [Blastocatellia bacterium]
GLANIVLTGIWYVLALPKSQGGLFDFMKQESGRLVPTGAGKLYFIVTGFAITIPLVWVVLAMINRRSRDFNLHEQRQLQIRLRSERMQKPAEAQPAE